MALDEVSSVGKGFFYCPATDISTDMQTKQIELEINKCNSISASCNSAAYIDLFYTKRVFTTGVFERKPVVKDNTIFMTPNVIITN